MPSLVKAIGAGLCLVFALSFAAPNAHADSITDGTINFTVTIGSPAATGSFVFDNTTSTFTTFTVGWDGAVINFAPLFADLASLPTSGTWCASAGEFSISTCGFFNFFPPSNFLLGGALATSNGPFTDLSADDIGTYTVTETVVGTPEPSSLALMLSGVGLVFATRKRWALGLQQAS